MRYFPIIIILILEIVVFYCTGWLTDDLEILHSIQARYSARISFTLLSVLGIFISSVGLSNIYSNNSKRNLLVGGITAFTINHLIHYYFLYKNFEVNGLDISSMYISFGALGYVILTIAPILIWNWTKLSKRRYYVVNGFIILMIGICIYTYMGRFTFTRELPYTTPAWLFKIMIGIGVLVIMLLLGRILKERKFQFDEMD